MGGLTTLRVVALAFPLLMTLLLGAGYRFTRNRNYGLQPPAKRFLNEGRGTALVRAVPLAALWVIVVLLLADVGLRALGGANGWAHQLDAVLGVPDPTLTLLFALLGILALGASTRIKLMTLDLWADARDNYLDFHAWADLDHKGPRWRYLMKWWYVERPEPIDAITIVMVRESESFDVFERRVKAGDWPKGFEAVMRRKFWGWYLPSVESLLRGAVLQGIFRSPIFAAMGKTPADLYQDLRSALWCPACRNVEPDRSACVRCAGTGWVDYVCFTCRGTGLTGDVPCAACDGQGVHRESPPVLFMQRLQYLWMARNVAWIEARMPLWLTYRVQAAVVLVGAVGYWLALAHDGTVQSILGTLVAGVYFGGSLLVVSSAAILTLFLLLLFQGTGTFELAYPLADSKIGLELWPRFTSVIISISVLAFVMYSVGMPVLLFSAALEHQQLSQPFVLIVSLSALTFGFFAFGNLFHMHVSMGDAKRSKLGELKHALTASSVDAHQRELDDALYKEVRDLREWPIDFSAAAAVVSGFVLPTALQFFVYLIPPR